MSAGFSALLQLYAKDGKITVQQVYRDGHHQNNMFNTVAVLDGVVYGFAGGAGHGVIEATNLADGQMLWSHEGKEWGCDRQLIVADGLIFALTGKDLVLVEANRNAYRELGRIGFDIDMGAFLQQPTLANGRLYLRGEKWIACYDVTQKAK